MKKTIELIGNSIVSFIVKATVKNQKLQLEGFTQLEKVKQLIVQVTGNCSERVLQSTESVILP